MVKLTFGKSSTNYPPVPDFRSISESENKSEKMIDGDKFNPVYSINLPYESFINLSLKELADITDENDIYVACEGRGVIGEKTILKNDINSTKTIKEILGSLKNTNCITSMAIISRANNVENLIGLYSNKENVLPGDLNSHKLSNYVGPHQFNNIGKLGDINKVSLDQMTNQYNAKIPITLFNNNYSMLNQYNAKIPITMFNNNYCLIADKPQ